MTQSKGQIENLFMQYHRDMLRMAMMLVHDEEEAKDIVHEAFDLLHQLSNTQYAVNAQGRTITWYRSLPHYAMLHLVYHWNKNPKKK